MTQHRTQWGWLFELLADVGAARPVDGPTMPATTVVSLLIDAGLVRPAYVQSGPNTVPGWELSPGVEWPHARRAIRALLQAEGFELSPKPLWDDVDEF